ncbi:hypothetical protein HDU80_010478 [Chytriomyces hyalinus]|nr:hypothetical protein HDU80_010478 [Chytriomyces hyalinus]
MASRALLQGTTLATTTFFSADVAAQIIQQSSEQQVLTPVSFAATWDPLRSFKTAAFGTAVVGWYSLSSTYFLSRVFPRTPAGMTLPSAALHAVANQALFAPPLTFSFLYLMADVVYEDPMAFDTARQKFPDVSATAWTVLPASNALVNWGVRAAGPRRFLLNGIGLGWATYLALAVTPESR